MAGKVLLSAEVEVGREEEVPRSFGILEVTARRECETVKYLGLRRAGEEGCGINGLEHLDVLPTRNTGRVMGLAKA
jgi:hypothetical protein